MNSKHDRLLQDLRRDEAAERRAAVLNSGGRVLRHRRIKRSAIWSLATLVVLGTLAYQARTLFSPAPPQIARHTEPGTAAPKPVAGVQKLSDEELLALFPSTPVALVKLTDGHQKLLFLRPEDEAKYVGKL